MNLDVKEVSELLNISEDLLIKWISDGKVPAYKINDRYFLDRSQVEEWVIRQKVGQEETSTSSNGINRFNLFRALNKGELYKDIGKTSKEEVIRETIQRIAPSMQLDAEVLSEAILNRENLMSTAVGGGFAIPHTRDFLLNGPNDMVNIVFLPKPIEYESLDGEPVHTLFFLLACEDKRHLSLISKIAHLITNPKMNAFLKSRPEKVELLETIRNWEANLPVR